MERKNILLKLQFVFIILFVMCSCTFTHTKKEPVSLSQQAINFGTIQGERLVSIYEQYAIIYENANDQQREFLTTSVAPLLEKIKTILIRLNTATIAWVALEEALKDGVNIEKVQIALKEYEEEFMLIKNDITNLLIQITNLLFRG